MTTTRFAYLTITSLVALGVLLSLGGWQIQRMSWKQDVLSKLEARAAADPVTLARALEVSTRSGEDAQFLKVAATGQFRHAFELHLFGLANKQPGWRIITPLETSTGDVVLVVRGFVPEALKEAGSRRAGQVPGTVSVVGQVRYTEVPGMFIPENAVQSNQWYSRDLTAMQAALPADLQKKALPFFIELEKPAHAAQWPKPSPLTASHLHNRHLQYALTWFGLAAVLVAIYGAMLVGRLKT